MGIRRVGVVLMNLGLHDAPEQEKQFLQRSSEKTFPADHSSALSTFRS
jgi:hypothetical protein